MRLIDADKLYENFETFYNTNVKGMPEEYAALYCNLATMIMQSPTAYDINKVIVRLSADIEPNIDCETGELLDNWVVDMQNDLTAEHIRIVSSGLQKDGE
ncbi:MAG: hypothetical protein K2N98_07470 [Lachnospiraceae bacterium]|nr:hypothetical protein [Lachnospiraceae bacterium]